VYDVNRVRTHKSKHMFRRVVTLFKLQARRFASNFSSSLRKVWTFRQTRLVISFSKTEEAMHRLSLRSKSTKSSGVVWPDGIENKTQHCFSIQVHSTSEKRIAKRTVTQLTYASASKLCSLYYFWGWRSWFTSGNWRSELINAITEQSSAQGFYEFPVLKINKRWIEKESTLYRIRVTCWREQRKKKQTENLDLKTSDRACTDSFTFEHRSFFVYSRGGEPNYYHGPHRLWIIAGGPQTTIVFNLKFYLYLTTRDRGFLWHTILTDRRFCLLSTCWPWSFVLTRSCTLNWLTKILMRAISNVPPPLVSRFAKQ